MKSWFKIKYFRFPTVILTVFGQGFFTTPSVAQIVNPLAAPMNSMASEYYVGKEYGKPLVAVVLVGGVGKAGIYHVPLGTDLAQLLAYAGGANEKADIEQISIRRSSSEGHAVFVVDLQRSLRSAGDLPVVQDGDVVNIPVRISIEKSLSWVSLISGVVSIGLSIAIIRDLNQRGNSN
ncbi:MAG: SLBB domain-containing protein [Bdellovibrionales bacterium]|nr:SLBB domain-containing protein [Bdellovibrionales bacterium]